MWPSHCLAPTLFSTAEVGARHEPGATRVGPRARRARLTKSGAAPCGRATGNPVDAGASGRDLKPESDLTFPALPAAAGLSPRPVGLSVPFSRRTSLPLARAAPAKGKPQLRALGTARREPPGLQVRGRDGLNARACQPAFPLPLATRARARPPCRIKHALHCRGAPDAIRQEPASSPAPHALPWEPEEGKTGRRKQQRRQRWRGAPQAGAQRSRGEPLPQWPSSGAEPPAPRALAAAAEAEPAQPPNSLPHPRRRHRPPPPDARSPRPAHHPRPL